MKNKSEQAATCLLELISPPSLLVYDLLFLACCVVVLPPGTMGLGPNGDEDFLPGLGGVAL